MNNHIVLSAPACTARVYDFRTGELRGSFEAHNATVGGPGFGHFGNCPPGDYRLGATIYGDGSAAEVPYGPSFTYLLDVHGLWRPYDRAGIGLHGGGTGSPHPFDPEWQGAWIPTEGCWRFRNGDLGRLFGTSRTAPRLTSPGDLVTVFAGAAR